jgi:hypothetical protein
MLPVLGSDVMNLFATVRLGFAVCAVAFAAACSAPAPQSGSAPGPQTVEVSRDVAELTAGLLAMSADIDPQEAARAARIAYSHTATLKEAYQITDGPLIHNIKVNNGTKPRGLCWHWAEDMETRLGSENFETLELHRAIANYDNWRLEHSTVIISAKGDSMYDGMVLDPWRKGGTLFWEGVRADRRYNWTPRQEVFDWKRERGLLTVRYVTAAGG